MHEARFRPFASVLFLVAAILAASLPASADDAQDEAIAKFKKYIGNPNPDSRASIVNSLAKIDCAEAVEVLLPCLGDKAWEVRAAALKVLSDYRSDDSVRALEEAVAGRLSGRVRSVAAMALGNIGHPTSVPVLAEASTDRDWEVRRAVAEALGSFRSSPDASRPLRALLGDDEEVIRTMAADSLGKVGDPEAVPDLVGALDDPYWQVQAAAAASLAEIRDERAIEPLIELMRRSGRLQADARDALEKITPMKFGIDPDRWQEWWNRNREGFKPPEQEKAPRPASGGAAGPNLPGEAGGKYARNFTRYYGIPTPSEKILFLLDVSRSMDEAIEIWKPERLGDRTFGSDVKMEIAKEELARTISELGSNVYFNIIVYHTDVDEWKSGLQPATDSSKNSARAFIERQKARGAAPGATKSRGRPGSRGGRSTSKLPDEEGRTNIFGALARAFAISGVGTYDRHYNSAVDTIFLLSDGEPTAGILTKSHEIRAEIARLNKLNRVVIHTINFGKSPAGAGLLRDLANENGGTYVDLVGETSLRRR
jgi:HEAT repeat protein